MYRNVLVPVDSSALSEHALPWALASAGAGGTVHLVHVHEYRTPMAVEGMVFTGPAEDQAQREAEDTILMRLAQSLRAAAPSVTITARNIDPDGPFTEGLVAAIAESRAELVVASTHGRGPLGRFLMGSVTDSLIRHSPVPVLALRPSDPDAAAVLTSRPRLERLVIALDGSAFAERIIEPALRFGRVFSATFTLAIVDKKLGDEVKSLDRTFESIVAAGEKVTVDEVQADNPVEGLLSVAGTSATTGIALATHGRSGVGRLLHGSVADALLQRAAGPVLVLHPTT